MSIHQHTDIQAYQLKAGGSRARMAILRMIAAESVKNRNESTRLQPGDWRGARHWTLGSYESAYAMPSAGLENGKTPVWYTQAGEYFRNERDAGDILPRMGYTGWYTDTDCSELAIGIVASLPHGRFIAGYRWTSNDERVYFLESFDDESDAARMADEHARIFGESAMEDSERYNAMTLAELGAEEKTIELQKAIALRHRAKFGGFDRVRDAIQELREARDALQSATADYERG